MRFNNEVGLGILERRGVFFFLGGGGIENVTTVIIKSHICMINLGWGTLWIKKNTAKKKHVWKQLESDTLELPEILAVALRDYKYL